MDVRCWEPGDSIKFLTLIKPWMRLTLMKVRAGRIWEVKGQTMRLGQVWGWGVSSSVFGLL